MKLFKVHDPETKEITEFKMWNEAKLQAKQLLKFYNGIYHFVRISVHSD